MRVRQHVNPLKSNFFTIDPEPVAIPDDREVEVELGSAEAHFLMDRARVAPRGLYVGVEIVKDAIGPQGSVSIVVAEGASEPRSADMNTHTKTNQILYHPSALGPDGSLARPDDLLFSADLPKTRSGKIMRRLLRDVAEGRALGDTTTLADPAVVAALKEQYEEKES